MHYNQQFYVQTKNTILNQKVKIVRGRLYRGIHIIIQNVRIAWM